MAVTHAVRSTLATLLAGVVAQRLLQLAAFLCIGRALGAEQLGVYAQGIGIGALLSVLAGAGVRNVLVREVARSPIEAAAILRRAVRARLATGALLAASASAVTFAVGERPWFHVLCILQVLPAAFDLKNLLDAIGRTRTEVAFDTTAAALQLVLVVAWWQCGGRDLEVLAAIALASRSAYALLALPTIARLPHTAEAPTIRARPRAGVAIGQTLHESLAAADVWLVALCFGNGAAGLYAVAARFATAALLPSAQLARLLLPHLLHANERGDAGRTFDTAARATALATMPMFAGGAVVADHLCALPGPEFAAAGPALATALLAGCLQHGGWQRSHALLAAGRDDAYGRSLAAPALLQIAAIAVCGRLLAAVNAGGDATAAAVAAAIGACAHGIYFVWTGTALRDSGGAAGRRRSFAPTIVAVATAVAAAVPGAFGDGPATLAAQLAAGAAAFGGSLWWVELRGRVRRIGDGLVSASGFRA